MSLKDRIIAAIAEATGKRHVPPEFGEHIRAYVWQQARRYVEARHA